MRGKRMLVIGASIAALAGLAAVPAFAGGDDVASEAARRGGAVISEALDGLVEDGVLSREQADLVEEAIREAAEEARPSWTHQAHPGLATAAETIGIEIDELMEELRSGATIAEVADANGVDAQDVVAAMAAEVRTRLEHAVEEGHLTQERADELQQGIQERTEALVNGELAWGGGAFGPGPGGPGPGGFHGGPGPGIDGQTEPTAG